MQKAGAIAAAFMLFAVIVPASAQSISAPLQDGIGDPGVGVGIMCNTSEQAEHFISLRSGGAAAPAALDAVNTQANDTKACGVAAVAFLRDETLKIQPMGDRLVQIVRINVVAGFNGKGWQRASTMTVQYAVIEAQGRSI